MKFKLTALILLSSLSLFGQVENWELEFAPDSNYIKISYSSGEYYDAPLDILIEGMETVTTLGYDTLTHVLTYMYNDSIVKSIDLSILLQLPDIPDSTSVLAIDSLGALSWQMGAIGPVGPQGPPGAAGADGAQGPPGADGANGADGAQGPAGADGADGINGLDGAQGPAGNDGAIGPIGPQGPQGLTGPAGTDGIDGSDGAQGPPGDDGIDGLDGAQGPAGPSDWTLIPNIPADIADGDLNIYDSNGTLSSNRVIDFSGRNMHYDLTGTGDFNILNEGVPFFSATDAGHVGIGMTNPTDIFSISHQQDGNEHLKESIFINNDINGGVLLGNRTHRGVFFDYDAIDVNENGKNLTVKGIESNLNFTGALSTGAVNVYGNYSNIANNSSGGILDNVYGNYVWVNQDDAGGTIEKTYANYARIDRDAGASNTNYLYYGIYQGTHTTKWGLYLQAEDKNYLSGNLGLGTLSPSEKLHVAGNMKVENHIIDSNQSDGINGQVLGRDNGGIVWQTVPIVPTGGNNGQLLATDGSNNLSWVDDQTGGGGTADGVVNSATGTIGSPSRNLNRTIGSPVLINVQDEDHDPTNEIEVWSTLSGIPADIADGDDDTQLTETEVDNFVSNNGYLLTEVDGSITNEIELPTGGNSGDILETDGAGSYTWVTPASGADGVLTGIGSNTPGGSVRNLQRSSGLSDLNLIIEDADANPVGEAQTISKSGSLVTLTAVSGTGGGSYTDDVDDADSDPTNEIETWATLSGIPADISDGDDDTQLTESQVDAFANNNGYLTSFTEVDGSITNEIELPTGGNSGDILETNGAGSYTWVTPASGADGVLTGIGSNTPGGSVRNLQRSNGLSDLNLIIEDADANPVGEAQTISKSGSTISLSAVSGVGGGSITDSDGVYDGSGLLSSDTEVDLNGSSFILKGSTGETKYFADGNTMFFTRTGAGTTSFSNQFSYFNISTAPSRDIRFNTGGDVSAFSQGFLGLGITSPAQMLHVDGHAQFNEHIYDSNGAQGTNGQFLSRDAGGIVWGDAVTIPTGGTNGQILTTDGTGTAGGLFWSDDQTGGGGGADGVVTGFVGNTSGTPTRDLTRSIGSTLTLNIEDGDSDATNELDGDGIYEGSGNIPTGTVSTVASSAFGAWKINNGDAEFGPMVDRWRIQDLGSTNRLDIGISGAGNGQINSDVSPLELMGNSPSPSITLSNNQIQLHHDLADSDGNLGQDGQVLQVKSNTNGQLEWVDKSAPSYGGMMVNGSAVNFNTGDTNQYSVDWTSGGSTEKNASEDLTTDVMTLEKPGIYMVSTTISVKGDTGARMVFKMYKDGSYQGDYDVVLSSTNVETFSWTQTIRSVTSPADIDIRYNQVTSTAPNVDTLESTSRFEVVKISDI